MCFERKSDYIGPNSKEQKPLIGKDSDLELLRKTSKTKIGEELTEAQKEIKKIVDKHISAITTGKDKGDKI